MIATYPKEVVALVEAMAEVLAGRHEPEQCREPFQAVAQIQQQAEKDVATLELLVSDHEEVLAPLRAHLKERQSLLGRLAQDLKENSGRRFQELSHKLQELTYHVEQLRAQLEAGAPTGVERVLKVAEAVRAGHCSPQQLFAQLSPLMDVFQGHQRKGVAFARAYPEPRTDPGTPPGRVWEAFQHGMGAWAHFLEAPDEHLSGLADGIELMSGAHQKLRAAEETMDEVIAERGYHTHLLLDEFAPQGPSRVQWAPGLRGAQTTPWPG